MSGNRESLDEKMGIVIGKLEAQESYMRELSHFIRDEANQTRGQFETLKEHVDHSFESMDTRLDDLEESKHTVVVIVRTIKVVVATVVAVLAFNWNSLLKFIGK